MPTNVNALQKLATVTAEIAKPKVIDLFAGSPVVELVDISAMVTGILAKHPIEADVDNVVDNVVEEVVEEVEEYAEVEDVDDDSTNPNR